MENTQIIFGFIFFLLIGVSIGIELEQIMERRRKIKIKLDILKTQEEIASIQILLDKIKRKEK